MEAETGYPSDEDFRQMRKDLAPSNDLGTWPVAPVPWLQPEEPPQIISGVEVPNPASIGASLFEDSWGKPLEDTGGVT